MANYDNWIPYDEWKVLQEWRQIREKEFWKFVQIGDFAYDKRKKLENNE